MARVNGLLYYLLFFLMYIYYMRIRAVSLFMEKTKFSLHMISDSSGETLLSVARASLSHFEDIIVKEYVWSLINTKDEIDDIVNRVASYNPSFVIYTIVDDDLREYLKQKCQRIKVPCIPILSRVIREISSYLGVKPNASRQHYEVLSDDYYSKIDAMNYVLSHDDGQGLWDIDEANIALIGVSRTSKSPTSIYLAYRGYKVCNIPFIAGVDLPLEHLNDKLVIGLTIDVDRLIEIRKNRVMSMGKYMNDNKYLNKEEVKRELLLAKRLFHKNKWPVIDVTKTSVEEISARVIQYYYKFNNK